jgi:hypothetical protein
MNIAVIIAHEIKAAEWNRDRFCANTQKPANVNDDLRICPHAMEVVDGSDLVIIDTIDCGAIECVRIQFRRC